MASLAANAAWSLGKWEDMESYVEFISPEIVNGKFYRALLEIHKNNFATSQVHLQIIHRPPSFFTSLTFMAQAYINRTRELLDTELRALVGESYSRAYKVVLYLS